jgi:HAE1 family hydrophobic/amphiphilic exporter-1
MKFSLPQFALKHPIMVIMIAVTLLGLGLIAIERTPLRFLPEMEFPFLGCFIPYPGATPEQVEKEVAIPAEGEFRTISHLKSISSHSSSEGCWIGMRLEWDADMGVATAAVRDRIERLKLVLPDEIERVWLRRWNSNTMPVLVFAMGKEGDIDQFAYDARTILRTRLSRLPGVADVIIHSSTPEKEIMVEFDQDILRRHNLPVYQVVAQLQSASLNLAAGNLIDGNTKYYVRTEGEFRRPEELAKLVVSPSGLRLKDVAKVGYNVREAEEHYELDGKGGVFVIVRKEAEANTVATCRLIRREIESVCGEPAFMGAQVLVFFDQSESILDTLRSLFNAGKFGVILAVAILYVFLRRIRPTLLVALAIPGSLVCAFIYMYFAGKTLNIVSMISMIVGVGMLVDNSIVVVENIYHFRRKGFGIVESSWRGAGDVGLAITASTITTIVVFIPVFYLQTGEMSTYMREFAGPMGVALVASLFVALTIIPLATSRMKDREHVRAYRWAAGLFDKLIRWTLPSVAGKLAFLRRQFVLEAIMASYRWLLRVAMCHRLASMLVLAAVLAGTLFPYQRVGKRAMPDMDMRRVDINIELDQNFNMEMAGATVNMLVASINKQRQELGIKNAFTEYTPAGGVIEVNLAESKDLKPGEEFKYTTDEVLDILWKRLPERMPGVRIKMSVPEAEGEMAAGSISVSFKGDDSALLSSLADQFRTLMQTLPDVSDVELDTERDKHEVQLHVDSPLAAQAGVSPWLIARTVDVALRGTRLPYMKQGGREVPVWAQFREEDRKSKDNLDNVAVFGSTGSLVPLSQLVEFTKAKSQAQINRIDGKNVVNLTAKISTKDFMKVQTQLKSLMRYFDLPQGYSIKLGTEFEQLAETVTNYSMALVLAIILVYIVMAALFESYVLPLSILTTVPISFVGVFWFMFFTSMPMDTVSFIGCILMVGVVVNNGIVIVDHMNNLLKEGMPRLEAIIQSGDDRFRPVMMTALTTILGCLPLTFGGSDPNAATFKSIGGALTGGLTVGTVLTLFVVPVVYSLLDDLRLWFLSYAAGFSNLLKARRAALPTSGDV